MKSKLIPLFLSTAFLVSFVWAGTIKSHGTAGATQLLVPVGAENIAVSGANGATVTGVGALYLNPAGAAGLQTGFQGQASTMKYLAGINLTYAGIVTNLGRAGSVGFSIKTFDFGDIPVTTALNTEGTGEFFSPNFMVLTGTYAKSFADRINFGANFKFVSEQIVNTTATGLAIDLGVQYKFLGAPASVGVVLRNLGSRMEYQGADLEQKLRPEDSQSGTLEEDLRIKAESFELPAELEIAVNYQVIPGLNLMGSFANFSFNVNSFALAGKYAIGTLAWVAAGTSLNRVGDDQPTGVSDDVWSDWTGSIWGPTFGGGLNVPVAGMQLGVAYSIRTTTGYFANNSVVELTLEF